MIVSLPRACLPVRLIRLIRLTYLADPYAPLEPPITTTKLDETGTMHSMTVTVKTAQAKEFSSGQLLREFHEQQKRRKAAPNECFSQPIAEAQKYGWREPYPKRPNEAYSMPSTDVTKFADALVRNSHFQRF
eukprot:tig00021612_g22874.t1